MGLFVEHMSMDMKDVNATASVTSLGGTIIGRFGNPSAGHFRAGLGLSYEMESSDAVSKDATGLGLRVFAGYAHPLGEGTHVFAQLGLAGSPTGGNSDVDVTWGPMWTLSLGLEYGK